MFFESDSDENFDLYDSGSEYMGENIEFSESDHEISDIEQNINTQTQLRITDNMIFFIKCKKVDFNLY